MIIQLSFDSIDLDKSIAVLDQVKDYADIIELGNLLLFAYGIQALKRFKEHAPNKTILVDSKIIEKGKETTDLLIQHGADWVTVMAGTHPNIIRLVTETAHNMKKKVMIDVSDALSQGQSALEAKNLGADAILFHHHYDEQNPQLFLEKWDLIKGNTQLPIFIEARINHTNIEQIKNLQPAGIIIGKSMMQSKNPAEEIEAIVHACKVSA